MRFDISAKAFVVTIAAVTAGCQEGDGRAAARVRAEADGLRAALDSIEDRLLANQAKVKLWQELASRHEEVSEIACSVQNGHALAMVEGVIKQQEKFKARRSRHLVTRVVGVEAGMGGPVGSPVSPSP